MLLADVASHLPLFLCLAMMAKYSFRPFHGLLPCLAPCFRFGSPGRHEDFPNQAETTDCIGAALKLTCRSSVIPVKLYPMVPGAPFVASLLLVVRPGAPSVGVTLIPKPDRPIGQDASSESSDAEVHDDRRRGTRQVALSASQPCSTSLPSMKRPHGVRGQDGLSAPLFEME